MTKVGDFSNYLPGRQLFSMTAFHTFTEIKHLKQINQRIRYAGVAVLLIVIALGLRAVWTCLPYFINFWIGDFLWAMMLYYLSMALFLPANKFRFTAGLVVFCWLVEASLQHIVARCRKTDVKNCFRMPPYRPRR